MFFSEIYQPGVADFDPSGKLGYDCLLYTSDAADE